jgi:hypothetical protein
VTFFAVLSRAVLILASSPWSVPSFLLQFILECDVLKLNVSGLPTSHRPNIHFRLQGCGKGIFGSREAGREKFVFNNHSNSSVNISTDAKTSPQGVLGNDVAGVGNANSGSAADQLTRQHRMTLDEAQLILNVKRETPMEQIMKVGLCLLLA